VEATTWGIILAIRVENGDDDGDESDESGVDDEDATEEDEGDEQRRN
jgi:hypothetical protein